MAMAAFQNCNVGLIQRRDSGDARVGHSFSILSDNRPIADFLFATEDDALEAWAEMRQVVSRAVEIRLPGLGVESGGHA